MSKQLTFDAAGWPNVLPVLEAKDFRYHGKFWWAIECFRTVLSGPGLQFLDILQTELELRGKKHDRLDRLLAEAWNAACRSCGYTVDCEVEDLWG